MSVLTPADLDLALHIVVTTDDDLLAFSSDLRDTLKAHAEITRKVAGMEMDTFDAVGQRGFPCCERLHNAGHAADCPYIAARKLWGMDADA